MRSVWFRVCSPTSGKPLLALLCPLVSFCSHPYVLCLALCGASASLGLSGPPPHTALCISGDPSGSFPVLLYCWDAHPKGGEATQPVLTCCPFLPSNGWLRPSKLRPHAPMTLRITLSVDVGCHLRPPHPSAPELCHLCTPTSGPF